MEKETLTLTLEMDKNSIETLKNFRIVFRLKDNIEVLRLGLALLMILKEARENGNKMAVVDKKGAILKEIVW